MQMCKGIKVQRCNTALYNGVVPHNSTVLLNDAVQLNNKALIYGMAWHLTMEQC